MAKILIRLENSLSDVSTSNNFKGKYITWECTTQCNYACSYCWPACHDGKYRWPDEEKTNRLIEYIKDFSQGQQVVLDIMGGEPTLWPDLQRFCHAVSDYSLITFSSNGSRTARWWRDFTAPINHLLFSFHPENADIDHYVEMLREVHTRYRITVFILYHPMFKETCLRAWDRLTAGDLEIAVKMKRINTPDNSSTIIPIKYTEDDREILLRDYFNCVAKMKYVDMEMFIDGEQVNPDELIAKDQHRFTGWHCQLGQNYRYIRADGSIYGAACGVATSLGNVYEQGEIKKPEYTTCTTKFCDCRVDLILNTKDVVRKNKFKENLLQSIP